MVPAGNASNDAMTSSPATSVAVASTPRTKKAMVAAPYPRAAPPNAAPGVREWRE